MVDYVIGALLAALLVFSAIRVFKRSKTGGCNGCTACSVYHDKNAGGSCGNQNADK